MSKWENENKNYSPFIHSKHIEFKILYSVARVTVVNKIIYCKGIYIFKGLHNLVSKLGGYMNYNISDDGICTLALVQNYNVLFPFLK